MGLKSVIKGFLKMSGVYAGSATYLAEHGYTDEYMELLEQARAKAKKKADRQEGQALYAQALMFRGELKRAAAEYEKVDIDRLPKAIKGVVTGNFILCLFLLEKPAQIKELLSQRNAEAFSGSSLIMRRNVGIQEYVNRRYENAVTVFVKLVGLPDPRATLMADICLVKTLLKLDMNDRAREIAGMGFDRYNGRGELTTLVNSLRLRINSPKDHGGSGGKKKKKHK